MRQKKLSDYQKTGNKRTSRPRSVNIRSDQLDFLDRNNINLSEFVRDALDDFISQNKTKAK